MVNGFVTRLVRRTLELFSRNTLSLNAPSTSFFPGHGSGSGGPVGLSLLPQLAGKLPPDTSILVLHQDVHLSEPLPATAAHPQFEDVDLSEPLLATAAHPQIEDVDLSEPLPATAAHPQFEDVDLSEPLLATAAHPQFEDVDLSEPEPLPATAAHPQFEDADLSEPLPATAAHLQFEGDLLPADMPLSPASPAPSPGCTNAQLVGLAFVQEYYSVLQASPEQVFRFYEESSTVSRLDSYGTMTTVTTIKAINDMVLDYYKVSTITVQTVDSQLSSNDRVLVAVIGCMTWPDMTERRFCQSFLLAYKGMGLYQVHNDLLRFTSETQPMVLIGSTSNVSDFGLQEVAHVQDYELRDSGAPPSDGVQEIGEEVDCTSENRGQGFEKELSNPSTTQPSVPPVTDVTQSMEQNELSNESYSSIVELKVEARSSIPILEKPSTRPRELLATSTKDDFAIEASTTGTTSVSQKDNLHDVGYSIYIKNLPTTATVEQVEMEFQRFGFITPGGIQVKRQKAGTNCFAFVEFESVQSMQNAIMGSPVVFEGRPAFVEQKKTTIKVRNGVIINGLSARDRQGTRAYKNDYIRRNGGSYSNSLGRVQNGNIRPPQQRPFLDGDGRPPQQRPFQNGDGRTC